MANRSSLRIASLVLTCLSMIPSTLAQPPQHEDPTGANIAAGSSGFCTDRLPAKQLRIWRSIEQIAQATDKAGRLLHPKLNGLWQWAQTSGHTIYIEMLDRKDPAISRAGSITLEQPDSNTHQQVAVIRLFLWVIDEATTERSVRRTDGFIPFLGLGKNERYAQVVGHELAHAVLMLESPEYARLCAQLDREKAEFHHFRGQSPESSFDQETRQRLLRLQALSDEIEKPAHATEVEIWRELVEGQKTVRPRRGV